MDRVKLLLTEVSDVIEYRSIEEMKDKNKYVGVIYEDMRFSVIGIRFDHGPTKFIGVSVGSTYITMQDPANCQFFVFDNKEEILDWLKG